MTSAFTSVPALPAHPREKLSIKDKKRNTSLDLHNIDCAPAQTYYSEYYQNYQLHQKLFFFFFPGHLEMPFCCQLGAFTMQTPIPQMEAEAIAYTHCKVKHQPSEQRGKERSDSLCPINSRPGT